MADWSGELEGVLITDGHFPLQCLGDQAVEVFARGLVDVHPATVGVGEGVWVLVRLAWLVFVISAS